MDIYYYDDPVEEPVVKRKQLRALFGVLLLCTGGLFLNTTLAANINIGTGGKVEFGQGISITAACSGSSVLTATPNSSFVNTSGSGDFYFSSVTVSGIPSSCNGVDFTISAYDSTTSTALPIFGTNKTVASVWNNGGSYQGGKGWVGSNITSGSGTFTVSFTTPVALATTVERLTLQSTAHVAGDCVTERICLVGDTGPGGGTVFYAGATFTETGTACNASCNYLELAPATWFSNPEQAVGALVTATSTPPSPTSTAFGMGWTNTNYLKNFASQTAPSGRKSGIYAAVRYGTAGAPVGEWFLPSKDELVILWNSPVNTRLRSDWYWSSSFSGNSGWEICLPNVGSICEGSYPQPFNGGYVDNGHSVRPIRAF
jgi:hypothetical protein